MNTNEEITIDIICQRNSWGKEYFIIHNSGIMNRSHIGEFVYGTLYRNRSVDDVCRMVFKLNNKLNERKDLDIRYVQLVCTSEKLLQKNEDGKSLSEGADYRISMETIKFQEIFKCCD